MKREHGFTLIELMVVVMIIGILIAIALPTFLGARERAQDRAAQSAARNGMAAAKVEYTDSGDYSGVTVSSLEAIEPNYAYVTTDSTGPNEVSVQATALGDEVGIAVWSEAGTCWYMRDTPTGLLYGSTGSAAACAGVDALTATGTGWS